MPIKVIMPQFDLFMSEGTIVEWLKKDGEKVEQNESVALIETSKVEAEVESPASGTFFKTQQIGSTIHVGETIALIVLPGEEVSVEKEVLEHGERLEEKPYERVEKKIERSIVASPAAKNLAKEHKIDLNKIRGTGPGGIITRGDVYAQLEQEPKPALGLEEEVIPLVGIRKTLAERVSQSMRTVAHITTIVEVDMTNLVNAREKLEKSGGTITVFLIKSVVQALKEYPILNSSLVEDKIIIKKYYNIGIAIAREQGLIVPVLHHAEKMSLKEIADNINILRNKAMEDKLSMEDVRGGTFTISNVGMLGVIMNTPIINFPESAILGVGKIIKRAVVIEDEIAIRSMIYLCLTYDHRIIDGAPAIRFLQRVKQLLESPEIF